MILREENGGFSKTNCTAIAFCKEKFICLLNYDMGVTKNWLQPLLERMESDPQIGAVQSKRIKPDEKHPNDWSVQTCGCQFESNGLGIYRLAHLPRICSQLQIAAEVDTFMATGLLLRINAIDQVGFFDESISKYYFEDTDLSLRLKMDGWRIFYEPLSEIYHRHASTISQIDKNVFKKKIQEEVAKFLAKWPKEKVLEIIKNKNN